MSFALLGWPRFQSWTIFVSTEVDTIDVSYTICNTKFKQNYIILTNVLLAMFGQSLPTNADNKRNDFDINSLKFIHKQPKMKIFHNYNYIKQV